MALLVARRLSEQEEATPQVNYTLPRCDSDSSIFLDASARHSSRSKAMHRSNIIHKRGLRSFVVTECSAFSLITCGKKPMRIETKSSNQICVDLMSILALIRRTDDLKMAVKLDSNNENRYYFCLITSDDQMHSCVLGFTFVPNSSEALFSLVIPCKSLGSVTLIGDGGFRLDVVLQRGFIFRPSSLKSLWSCVQLLTKIVERGKRIITKPQYEALYFNHYSKFVTSDHKILQYWTKSQDLASTVQMFNHGIEELTQTHRNISSAISEILTRSDVTTVTTKEIKQEVTKLLNIPLPVYNQFINDEMMRIFCQMDVCSRITDFLYLGSEWNAFNREELEKLGIDKILNTTIEIDNFFPGIFEYMNVPVWDVPTARIMDYFNHAYKFIEYARISNGKVLVHCQMGISRSATIVISYMMKKFSWGFKTSYEYVKKCRGIVSPNSGFHHQLETYEGILESNKHKETFNRSNVVQLQSSDQKMLLNSVSLQSVVSSFSNDPQTKNT